jgi:hypothetical protein
LYIKKPHEDIQQRKNIPKRPESVSWNHPRIWSLHNAYKAPNYKINEVYRDITARCTVHWNQIIYSMKVIN